MRVPWTDWLSARHSSADGQFKSLGEVLQSWLAEAAIARSKFAKIVLAVNWSIVAEIAQTHALVPEFNMGGTGATYRTIWAIIITPLLIYPLV